MSSNPKTIFIALLVVLLTILLLQNTQVISLKFLFWEISMSQIILIPIIFALGLAAGFFFGKNSW